MIQAGVAELVDAPDLGSGAVRRGGSSPFTRTIFKLKYTENKWLQIVGYLFPIYSPISVECSETNAINLHSPELLLVNNIKPSIQTDFLNANSFPSLRKGWLGMVRQAFQTKRRLAS